MRLTSLGLTIALSGSPAVLSACMALCLQGGPAVAMDHPDDASSHAHHGEASPASLPSVPAHDGETPHDSPGPCPSITLDDCCAGGVVVSPAGRAGALYAAPASGGAPVLAGIAFSLATAHRPGVFVSGPPVLPPSPARAPLVLRI